MPEPAIGKDTPGAEKFPGGFEGGTTIKVETAGKKRYHQFATGMGNLDWSENHLDYWVSDDGKNFQRKDVLRHQYVNKETGKTHQSLHPYPFFSEAENRWHMIFMEYVVEKQWDGESGKIWCVPSRNNGPGGIEGPWNFDERYELVPKPCAWSNMTESDQGRDDCLDPGSSQTLNFPANFATPFHTISGHRLLQRPSS